ncbi:MAG TPA: hypothetical protein DIT64_08160 [Verrucomicrobiales bacterium]|nr:hypothetical protein [Verrucomicrobiales bacterium]
MMRLIPCLALLFGQGHAALSLRLVDGMTRVPRSGAMAEQTPDLRAARGEWEPVQVVLSGAAAELKGVTVEVTALTAGEKSVIAEPEVLRAHYVRVSKPTPMSPMPPSEHADALVPQDFPWQELPQDTENVNQPFWVDLHVPYTAQPGAHSGGIRVRKDGAEVLTHPLSLAVLDFDMPTVPRLRSSIMTVWRRIAEAHGFDRQQEPPAPELAALLEEYHDLLARHRLSIDTIHPTFPDHRTGRLDETAVEMALRKHLLHRHASTISLPIWSQWPFADPLGADREAAQLYAATWMKVVKKLRCEARGYVIHSDLDEPNSADDYAMVRRWGDFFNEAEHKHGVRLPLLITEQPTPDDPWWGRLDGSVDIWVPHISSVWQDMEAPDGKRDIERRVKAGDEVWCYAALVQMPDAWERAHCKPEVLRESNPPVWCLDFPAMNHRIPAWVMPLHGITGFCYWDTLHAEPGVDVWADAGNFLHPEAGSYNGDGSYIYPATRERHGRHMPVASVRLKWLREMTEDYDYLMLARDLGLCNEAQLLADTFARGFGDWEDRMDKLFEARRKLADLIVRKGGRS